MPPNAFFLRFASYFHILRRPEFFIPLKTCLELKPTASLITVSNFIIVYEHLPHELIFSII